MMEAWRLPRKRQDKRLALAPESSLAHSRIGWVQTFLSKPAEAVASFEQSLELDPDNADSLSNFAEALNIASDPARAEEAGEASLRFEPVRPRNTMFHVGHGYFLLGHLVEADEYIGRAIELSPAFPVARLIMAATLTESGKLDRARGHIREMRKRHPQHNLTTVNQRYPYANNEHCKRVLLGLRLAGLPDG